MTKHVLILVRLAGRIVRLLVALVDFSERFPLDRLAMVLELAVHRLEEQPTESVPDPLRDAKYAAGRIGVADKTLGRLTKKGLLPVHSYVNRKRLFRESDIERCRRLYRGE